MPFKIHLIIISLIVAVVYFIWHTLQTMPAPVQTTVVQQVSPFSIEVNHATWGMNCKAHVIQPNSSTLDSAYMNMDEASKPHDDNALQKVSELCNGKLTCDVPVSAASLGGDPAPSCQNKSLQVEYRCFSYDRPWIVQAANGSTLTIDCDRPTN